MATVLLPTQPPGPQPTDQILPSWLSYSAYTTQTAIEMVTMTRIAYDPQGSIAPMVCIETWDTTATATSFTIVENTAQDEFGAASKGRQDASSAKSASTKRLPNSSTARAKASTEGVSICPNLGAPASASITTSDRRKSDSVKSDYGSSSPQKSPNSSIVSLQGTQSSAGLSTTTATSSLFTSSVSMTREPGSLAPTSQGAISSAAASVKGSGSITPTSRLAATLTSQSTQQTTTGSGPDPRGGGSGSEGRGGSNGTNSPTKDRDQLSGGQIAGIVLGSLALLTILAVCLFMAWGRRRRQNRENVVYSQVEKSFEDEPHTAPGRMMSIAHALRLQPSKYALVGGGVVAALGRRKRLYPAEQSGSIDEHGKLDGPVQGREFLVIGGRRLDVREDPFQAGSSPYEHDDIEYAPLSPSNEQEYSFPAQMTSSDAAAHPSEGRMLHDLRNPLCGLGAPTSASAANRKSQAKQGAGLTSPTAKKVKRIPVISYDDGEMQSQQNSDFIAAGSSGTSKGSRHQRRDTFGEISVAEMPLALLEIKSDDHKRDGQTRLRVANVSDSDLSRSSGSQIPARASDDTRGSSRTAGSSGSGSQSSRGNRSFHDESLTHDLALFSGLTAGWHKMGNQLRSGNHTDASPFGRSESLGQAPASQPSETVATNRINSQHASIYSARSPAKASKDLDPSHPESAGEVTDEGQENWNSAVQSQVPSGSRSNLSQERNLSPFGRLVGFATGDRTSNHSPKSRGGNSADTGNASSSATRSSDSSARGSRGTGRIWFADDRHRSRSSHLDSLQEDAESDRVIDEAGMTIERDAQWQEERASGEEYTFTDPYDEDIPPTTNSFWRESPRVTSASERAHRRNQ